MLLRKITTLCMLTGVLAIGQEKPAPVAGARKPAPGAAASPVDTVIQLLKGGMSESLILKTLQRQNKPVNLSPAEMLKLQKAGASDAIIGALMDPAAAAPPPPAALNSAAATTAAAKPAAAPAVTIPSATASTGTECPPPAAVSAVAGSQKRRLAVQAFDYSAVKNHVTVMFGNDVNIGQGIRAMLTAKMGQSKNVVLLERERLKAVIAEQDLGATNRVKQGSKAKIGGLTGADAILLGDIVIFGRDDQGKSVGAAGVGRVLPGIAGVGLGKFGRKTDKAVVAINLRLVDAETGEVLDSAEARGESKRTSTDWGALAGTWRGAAAASSSMTSSNFQDTIIGEATDDAVTKIVAFLDQKIPAIAPKSRTIEGRVATIDGCTLYLSVGGNEGVHVGDHFEIDQIVKEVIDPETKEVLDKQTTKLGDLVVGTVRDKTAIGLYGGPPLSSGLLAKPGYAARLITQ